MRRPTSSAGSRGRRGGRRATRARSARSAGGVVFRRSRGRVEIVLVGRRAEDLWALPKGTPDDGESIEQTAIREVREETGLEVAMRDPLGSVRYRFFDSAGTAVDKTVHYFLFEPRGGSIDAHDREHDRVEWFDIHEAERLLTHRNQLHILARAADLIARIEA